MSFRARAAFIVGCVVPICAPTFHGQPAAATGPNVISEGLGKNATGKPLVGVFVKL